MSYNVHTEVKILHLDQFQDIDEMIEQASKQSYSTLMSLGTKGLSYASQVVMRTAIMVSF